LYLFQHKKCLEIIGNKQDYIFQPFIYGNIFTVDTVRDKTGNCVAVARQELTRTSNGAGITVDVKRNTLLEQSAKFVANELNILGCINIEFIFDGNNYYLMDINPRFSAGVGFSCISGYDFVNNHLRCFKNEMIEDLVTVEEGILSRKSQIIHI